MKIERIDNAVYIELEEDLSFATVFHVRERIFGSLREEDRKLILNLSKVEFVDSRGLGLIISLYNHMKMLNGELIVEYPQLGVQKLIEMARLDQLFQVVKTPEEKTGHWSKFE